MIERIAVIGLGLMGGSFALAVKARGLAGKVAGFDVAPESRAAALARGVVDEAQDGLEETVSAAGLVLLAVPVLHTGAVLMALRDALRAGAEQPVITDVGSVKSLVLAEATNVFGAPPPNLVPGHPIAGSEKSGVGAAVADLFVDRKVILTPADESDPEAVALVADLWREMGAEVVTMAAGRHDQLLAGTSHLPHLLAYALVDSLSAGGSTLDAFRYAAGGFRDFSRIAASDPRMWHDIFVANGGEVLPHLDRYLEELGRLRDALETGDGDYLLELFRRAKHVRDVYARDAAGVERGASVRGE